MLPSCIAPKKKLIASGIQCHVNPTRKLLEAGKISDLEPDRPSCSERLSSCDLTISTIFTAGGSRALDTKCPFNQAGIWKISSRLIPVSLTLVKVNCENTRDRLWCDSLDNRRQHRRRNAVISKGSEMAPGVRRTYPTEPRKLFGALLWTRLCPSTVSLSIRASQPTKSLVTWVSIMNATFDYLCYSAAAHISLPATIHVWLDVLSLCFPPLSKLIAVLSLPKIKKKRKKTCWEHNSLKVVWILFKQNN